MPQLLQEGALAAGTTVCALGVGCSGEHSAFTAGTPPAEPGFEAPLVFAMQKKPAPKVPKHAAAAAVAAPTMESQQQQQQQQQQQGGASAAGAGSEQGTKRKRDGKSDDDDSGAYSADAAPLC